MDWVLLSDLSKGGKTDTYVQNISTPLVLLHVYVMYEFWSNESSCSTRNNFMQIVCTGEVNLQLTVTFCLAYISSNRTYVNFIYCLFLLHCFSVFKDLTEKKAYSAFMLVNHFSSTLWSYSYLKIFLWGKKKKLQALCFFERNDHFVRINYMFFHDFWNVFTVFMMYLYH